MPRKILILIVAAAIVAVTIWHFTHRNAGDGNDLVLYGNVDIRQVQLAFNGAERISKMLVSEGEHVKKGQLLATEDTTQLKHNVALQQARLDAQQQVVARLQAGSRPQEISRARAESEAARIAAGNAEHTYQRALALVARHFVAQQQADDAHATSDAAQARYQAAHQTLRLAELGPRKEDIAAAKAVLQADQAALDTARKALADAALQAPADGVIEARILEPGDMASPQKPVFTLALTTPLWVRAYVSEPDLGKIRVGARAEVSTDSAPDLRERGWVGYISSTAQFTPKSVETQEVRTALVYQVRVFVCNPQQQLRLGMPATVVIPLGQEAAAVPDLGADPCKDAG